MSYDAMTPEVARELCVGQQYVWSWVTPLSEAGRPPTSASSLVHRHPLASVRYLPTKRTSALSPRDTDQQDLPRIGLLYTTSTVGNQLLEA